MTKEHSTKFKSSCCGIDKTGDKKDWLAPLKKLFPPRNRHGKLSFVPKMLELNLAEDNGDDQTILYLDDSNSDKDC